MKTLFKRILIMFCCTVLLTSSVFMSYTIPVYANTNYEDLLKDAVDIALAAAGIYVVVQSGGTLAPLIIPYIETLAGTGFDVYDYVTQDEEAGTTTISADFVNLVLQAYNQYKLESGDKFDGTVKQDADDMYYIYGETVHTVISPSYDWNYVTYVSGFKCAYPVALLYFNNSKMAKYLYWGKYNFDTFEGVGTNCIAFFYNGNSDSKNGGISLLNEYFNMVKDPAQPFSNTYRNGEKDSFSNNFSVWGVMGDVSDITSSVSSSTIPVYTNFDLMVSDLQSGEYTHAYNYGKIPECESPSYTGEYNGGDITILTASLNALREKIAELEKSNKSLEEKLKELLEYLKLIGSGGGGTGGGDVNVDIDLSTTNGLLSKILAKVTQIFEKMNAAVEDAESAAMAKIQESLDEIIVQLKKIKRWTAVDTVIDGVDAIADWLDLIRGVLKDAEEGAGSAVATIASAVGDSVDTMSRKFPFSIPWDILFFVSVLSAEPQVPHFEIPFNIELSMLDITIDYTMELDFTQLQWLSDLSRLLLSMTYAVGLMRMTFGVTSAGKEE